jgi:hypothetical protein
MSNLITIETLGEQVDRIENLAAGLNMPLDPSFHIQQLKGILPQISEVIKQYYINTTGENPWE